MPNPELLPDAGSRRLAVLARVLESFTATLDLEELLLRMVNTALEEFGADRAWLLHPANLTAEFGRVVYEVTRPGWEGAYRKGEELPLAGSRDLIRAALDTGRPVISYIDDPGVDKALWERFHVRSRMMQVLTPTEDEPWMFGMHQCSHERRWSDSEADLFHDIGRYAAIALNNAVHHRRAVTEAATVSAIIDQIPEAVAIYGPEGSLRRMNSAARTKLPFVFGETDVMTGADPAGSERTLRDPRTGEERTVMMKSSPVLDRDGSTLGTVFVATDITGERHRLERDAARRSRAECLAYVGLDLLAAPGGPIDLSQSAALVSTTLGANVAFYLYVSASDTLQLVGGQYADDAGEEFLRFVERHPYHPGEGLPGTVFQIGHALFFPDVRGEALTGFARNGEEERLTERLQEESLIACPIESYGERIGALVISAGDADASFEADDLAFAEAVAERVGAAVRIHRLTRIAQEGHRAAEELARREVEARTRLEAVLDSAPVAVAVVSADELRFESANPPWIEYAARFGRVAADSRLVGLRATDVIPGLERSLRQAAESGGRSAGDRARRRDLVRQSDHRSRSGAPLRHHPESDHSGAGRHRAGPRKTGDRSPRADHGGAVREVGVDSGIDDGRPARLRRRGPGDRREPFGGVDVRHRLA
jgi:GAF domain-containing protein